MKPGNFFKHWIHRTQGWFSVSEATLIGLKQRAYGIDLSRWEPEFNPDAAVPGLLDFGIIKATEGTTWQDPAFEQLYVGIAKLAVQGAYHYLRSGASGVTQANHFLATTAGKKLQVAAVDFEGIGNTLNDEFVKVLYDCLMRVTTGLPNARVVLYTNPNLYDTVIYPAAMRIWGRDIFLDWDLWIAQYYFTVNADGEPAMPKSRKDWKLWQFSDAGSPAEHGTKAYVDRNIFNGSVAALKAWAGSNAPVPPGIVDGYQKIRRYNSDVHIWRGKPSRIHVTNTHGQLETVSRAAQRFAADLAINGDGWLSNEPLSLAASDGDFYQPMQFDLRPYMVFDDVYVIAHAYPARPHNLVSGTRYLVKAGANFFEGATDPEHVSERNPRTAAGYTPDGWLILCVVDGHSVISAGVTLKELAEIQREAGAWYALELDGGGSSAMYVRGANSPIVNEPSDGQERSVINHVLVWTGGANMANGTAKEKLGKVPTVRSSPHAISGNGVRTLPAGALIEFMRIVDDLDHPGDANYKWFEIGSNEFTPYVYPPNGERFTILSMPSDTPPTPEPGKPDLNITVEAVGYPLTKVTIKPL
jgi:GH25 family lysozyme M1 (1,4-beta-N-acetylmuramidase)